MADPQRPVKEDEQAELGRRRDAIDALDRELLKLLNERAREAQAIGALKGGAAYRPEREAQVLRALESRNTGPLSNEAVTGIFRQVMSACLALEQKLRSLISVRRARSATRR